MCFEYLYTRVDRRGKELINSQEAFYDLIIGNDDSINEKIHHMKAEWAENGFTPRVSEIINN